MKRYGLWVFLALVLSVLIHVAFYVAAGHMPPILKALPGQAAVIPVPSERVFVDQSTLDAIIRETQPVPEIAEPTRDQLVVEENLFQEESVPDLVAIKLTPEVDKMQNYLMDDRGAPVLEGKAVTLAEKLDVEISTQPNATEVRQQLLEASKRAMHQTTIPLGEIELESGGVDIEAVKSELMGQLGNGDSRRINDRFTPLEDLFERGDEIDGDIRLWIPADVLFDFNEAEVKEEVRKSLMKLGMLIMAYPDATFRVNGFTDSIGSQEYNLKLSQKRAEAVRDFYVRRLKLKNYNIEAIGYGKLQPLVEPTGDQDDEQLNRRVEIEIVRKP